MWLICQSSNARPACRRQGVHRLVDRCAPGRGHESLRRIFKVIKRRAAFHAEDEYRLNERKPLRVEGDPRSHPVWRDESRPDGDGTLVKLARETGKRIHVLHISTKTGNRVLARPQDVASCEATPLILRCRARLL